jgi:HEAT repeat protein
MGGELGETPPSDPVVFKDFFVSYNSNDTGWAQWIAWNIETAGFTTVLQCWDFLPGANFVLEMDTAIRTARRTLAVLSSHYLRSRFAQPEWAAAFAQDPGGEGKKLIPIRVEDIIPDGILRTVIYIDLVGKSEAAAREELITKLSLVRSKPVDKPTFPAVNPKLLDRDVLHDPQLTTRFVMVLTASVNQLNRPVVEAMVSHLRKLSDDTSLTFQEVQAGSIVIRGWSSRSGFERLVSLRRERQLENLVGLRVTFFGRPDELSASRGDEPSTPSFEIEELEVRPSSARDEHERALRYLRELYSERFPALKHDLLAPNEEVGMRLVLIQMINTLGPQAAEFVPELIALVAGREQPILRCAAADALGLIGEAAVAALDVVTAALADSNIPMRTQAARTLGKLGLLSAARTGAVSSLVRALGDPEIQVNDEIVDALGRIGRLSPEAVLSALRSSLFSGDKLRRIGIIKALGRIGLPAKEAVPFLITQLKNDLDRDVRAYAAETLTIIGLGDAAVVDGLSDALYDADIQVRAAVANGLGEFGLVGTSALPALQMLIARETDDSAVQAAIGSIGRLTNLSSSERRESLVAAFQNDDRYVRVNVAKALVGWEEGIEYALPALIVALGDVEPDVRFWAATALRSRKSKTVFDALQTSVSDENRLVREKAISILESFNHD